MNLKKKKESKAIAGNPRLHMHSHSMSMLRIQWRGEQVQRVLDSEPHGFEFWLHD